MIRLRIRVEGRVQGVFYRASTQSKALELGLTGWVKNEPDGSVLMEVQGAAETIQTMVDWCWIGPKMARVNALNKDQVSLEDSRDFVILR
jgi:acylphosphatase